jgi:hypothetical protein
VTGIPDSSRGSRRKEDLDIGSCASVPLPNVTPDTIMVNGSETGSDIARSAAVFILISGPQWI